MDDEIRFLNNIRCTATGIGLLLVAGIVALMVLTRGKTGDDGDIAGIVAPAVLLTFVSCAVAVVATVRARRLP